MFNANSEGDKTAKIHGKVWFIKNNKLTSLFINPILVNLVNFAVEMNLDFLNINGNLSIRAPVDDCFTINFQFPIRESKNIE